MPVFVDMRSAVEHGLRQHAASSGVLWSVRAALEAPLSGQLFKHWPGTVAAKRTIDVLSEPPASVSAYPLPDAGWWTRYVGIVPWLIGCAQRRERLPTVPAFMDTPTDVAKIMFYAAENNLDLGTEPFGSVQSKAEAFYEHAISGFYPRMPVNPGSPVAMWEDGSRIDRLVTWQNFSQEGIGMRHCLRHALHYYDDVLGGDVVLFSYRQNTPDGLVSVATWEIRIDPVTGRSPTKLHAVIQLQGPMNGAIGEENGSHGQVARDRIAWHLAEQLRIDTNDQNIITNYYANRVGLGKSYYAQPASSASWTQRQDVLTRDAWEADEQVRATIEHVEGAEEYTMTDRVESIGRDIWDLMIELMAYYGPRISSVKRNERWSIFELTVDRMPYRLKLYRDRGEFFFQASNAVKKLDVQHKASPLDALVAVGLPLGGGQSAPEVVAPSPSAEKTRADILYRGRAQLSRALTVQVALLPHREYLVHGPAVATEPVPNVKPVIVQQPRPIPSSMPAFFSRADPMGEPSLPRSESGYMVTTIRGTRAYVQGRYAAIVFMGDLVAFHFDPVEGVGKLSLGSAADAMLDPKKFISISSVKLAQGSDTDQVTLAAFFRDAREAFLAERGRGV